MLNLPNFLTLIRILTIPFFLVFLAYHRYSEALAVFIFGGVTDFLDGLAARWMNQQTALGAYLDPVADKLLVFASFVMLGMIDGIPMWLAIVVVSRDALILSGYAVIYLLIEERFHACFSPSQGGLLSLLRERGRIVEESYDGDEVHVTAIVTPKLAGQMRKLLRYDRDRGQAPAPN